MAFNKDKALQTAQKFLQKGAIDKAIKEYQRIIEVEPNDVRILLKIGDLYTKQGNNGPATETYLKVADFYSEQGFYLKAVAVYKQVLKIDDSLIHVNQKLAELYNQLGLAGDALSNYQIVAADFERQGMVKEALDTLRKIIELDPQNITSRVKLGELFAREGMEDEARESLEIAAKALQETGRIDDYMRVAERLSHLNPNDMKLVRDLAHYYVEQGDVKRALAKLQLCFKHNPQDIDTLNLLAKAFFELKQFSKTIAVYKELMKIHTTNGDHDLARQFAQKVLELAENDSDALSFLADSTDAQPSMTSATPEDDTLGAPPDEAIASEIVNSAEEEQTTQETNNGSTPLARVKTSQKVKAVVTAEQPTPSQTGEIDLDAPIGENAETDIAEQSQLPSDYQKIMNETEVFLRYGLHDKALSHLKDLSAKLPDNLDIWQKLRNIHQSMGNEQGFQNALQHIERLGGEIEEPPLEVEEIEEIQEIEAVEDEIAGDGNNTEVSPVQEGIAFEVADTEIITDIEPDDLSSEIIQETAIEPEQSQPSTPGEQSEEIPEAVSEEIDEAKFFIEQGLHDEALEIVNSIQERFADNQQILALIKPMADELGQIAPQQEEHAESTPSLKPEQTHELSAPISVVESESQTTSFGNELSNDLEDMISSIDTGSEIENLDDDQISMQEVLDEFKRGIEATVEEGDYATHYDLGQAYMEMGLIEEAQHEFIKAMKSADKEVDSLNMLGLCQAYNQDYGEAVTYYKKALSSDYITKKQSMGLRYEIGVCHHALGNYSEALMFLEKVHRIDSSFRNVQKLLDEVKPLADKEALTPSPTPQLIADEAHSNQESFELSDILTDESSQNADQQKPPPSPNPVESQNSSKDPDPQPVSETKTQPAPKPPTDHDAALRELLGDLADITSSGSSSPSPSSSDDNEAPHDQKNKVGYL